MLKLSYFWSVQCYLFWLLCCLISVSVIRHLRTFKWKGLFSYLCSHVSVHGHLAPQSLGFYMVRQKIMFGRRKVAKVILEAEKVTWGEKDKINSSRSCYFLTYCLHSCLASQWPIELWTHQCIDPCKISVVFSVGTTP